MDVIPKKSGPLAAIAVGLVLLAATCGCSKPDQKQSAPSQAHGQPNARPTPRTAPPGSPSGKINPGPCARLVAGKCNDCHSTERICERLGKNSPARWHQTVERMMSRGAKIDAGQADELAECLARNPPELQAACP